MSAALLIVRAGKRLLGLPLAQVSETMRPLPIESVPGVPAFVTGVAVVRGKLTPIVHLAALFSSEGAEPATRLVALRGDRPVGLLVDEVVGVGSSMLDGDPLPALLSDAAAGVVDHLARLDGELLTILRSGKLVPDEVWARTLRAEPS
jgi:purine-binding chemotaxis protein CheW